jgi:hypothetical protein
MPGAGLRRLFLLSRIGGPFQVVADGEDQEPRHDLIASQVELAGRNLVLTRRNLRPADEFVGSAVSQR